MEITATIKEKDGQLYIELSGDMKDIIPVSDVVSETNKLRIQDREGARKVLTYWMETFGNDTRSIKEKG
jgi:hypothetical protein